MTYRDYIKSEFQCKALFCQKNFTWHCIRREK